MAEFELTLNSPITEEQWDAITDVDFEKTDRIWFQTKHGKTVEFIKVKKATNADRIASADEVLQFYSDVMRGKVKDQFGLDAALTDRLNAGKELMKRHAAAGSITIGTQKPEDDALTKSLRELAEELMEGK